MLAERAVPPYNRPAMEHHETSMTAALEGVGVRRVFVHAFGCQMNAHEGERLLGLARDHGYQEALSAEEADLIVLHTCAVRDHAVQRIIGEVGRLTSLKQERPRLKIGITGCVAQADGTALLQRARGLDFVVGTRAVGRLPSTLRRVDAGERVVDVADGPYLEVGDGPVRSATICAYVTAVEGCDKFCTFCIVPYTRGREYSRPAAHILDEVRRLAASGCREVTLLGQTVNAYGRKGGGRGEGEVSFAMLLRQVAAVDGIARVRFLTSHPSHLGDDLIEAMAATPEVCPHLPLPLQSGSDRILAAMRRGYTVAEYLQRVAAVRAAVGELALFSDLIVGFPGESDADFEQTAAVVEELRLAGLYGFKYSPRPHTKAASLGDPIPEAVKAERLERILALQRRIAVEHNQALVGSRQEILVEEAGDGWVEGRTRTNRRLRAPAAGAPGELLQVRVNGIDHGRLVGATETTP